MSEEIDKVIRDWDANRPVWSVEMGGLGPGYEQCIQTLCFEIMKEYKDKELPEPDVVGVSSWARDVVKRLDPVFEFSGAQVGAARSMAYKFLKYGYKFMLDKAPEDRKIQVSKLVPNP